MASYSAPKSSRANGSSGISFSVSKQHNETYQSGSRRNPFLNGRTLGPRTNLTKNTFEPMRSRSNNTPTPSKPTMNKANFPTLGGSSTKSSTTVKTNWTKVAAKQPPKKETPTTQEPQKRDPNLLYNKNTGEYYPDTHMFKKRSGFYNDDYDRIREQEYEDELRQTLGDDEYYEWVREQQESEAYYDDRRSDDDYEDDYDY